MNCRPPWHWMSETQRRFQQLVSVSVNFISFILSTKSQKVWRYIFNYVSVWIIPFDGSTVFDRLMPRWLHATANNRRFSWRRKLWNCVATPWRTSTCPILGFQLLAHLLLLRASNCPLKMWIISRDGKSLSHRHSLENIPIFCDIFTLYNAISTNITWHHDLPDATSVFPTQTFWSLAHKIFFNSNIQ